MSSQGPLLAGSGADDASVGSQVWSAPGNIIAVDATYAQVSVGGGAVSHYLRSGTHGFSLAGATILGIVAEVLVKSTNGVAVDSTVKLAKAGSAVGTSKATSTGISTTLTWISYGSSSDLWGTTWTQEEINAAGFGLAYSISSTSIDTVFVDAVRITVYYSLGDATVNLSQSIAQPVSGRVVGGQSRVQQLGGTPGPDSDDDANIINQRVMIWNRV